MTGDVVVPIRPLPLRAAAAAAGFAPRGVDAMDACRYLQAAYDADRVATSAILSAALPGSHHRAGGVLERMFEPTPWRLEIAPGAGGSLRFGLIPSGVPGCREPQTADAYTASAVLNALLAESPAGAYALVETRFPFDDRELAGRHVVIGDGTGRVGFLGLLNGLLRPIGQAVAVTMDDDVVRWFSVLDGLDLPTLI